MSDEAALFEGLRAIVGDGGLLTEPSDRAAYESGWRYGRGRARAVVRPRTPEDVARVLALCHDRGIPVQPIGANTGLVGASNPDASGDQVVLSLERLNSILEVDSIGRTATVDAGMTLAQLNEALKPHGLFFPIDLGADPQIGGMVATNTGGTRLLRYGAVRENLLGLEVALADGTLWDGLSSLTKDNRGLDLKQLFIGTSGSFGVVTRAVLKLRPLPRQQVTAWVAMADGDATLRLLERLDRDVGECLSAFEVLSREAFETTLRHGADLQNPFAECVPSHAVLIELSSTFEAKVLDLDAVLLGQFEALMEEEDSGLLDAVPMPSEQAWSIRHQVSESLRHEGRVLALDVSVPRSAIARFSEAINAEVREGFPAVRVCDFGHWGDGGTHLNLVWAEEAFEDSDAVARELQTRIYERCVEEFGGSFSAEHGVGPHNQAFYERFAPALQLAVSRSLEACLDPEARLGTVAWGGRHDP